VRCGYSGCCGHQPWLLAQVRGPLHRAARTCPSAVSYCSGTAPPALGTPPGPSPPNHRHPLSCSRWEKTLWWRAHGEQPARRPAFLLAGHVVFPTSCLWQLFCVQRKPTSSHVALGDERAQVPGPPWETPAHPGTEGSKIAHGMQRFSV